MGGGRALVIDLGVGSGDLALDAFEAVLTFSFLIVRGVRLPRLCSVRRNLFGWAG